MVNPSTHLTNDEFGYACYTIVIPAPPELTEPLLEIERAAGQERAKIPAHVTVKGTFYGINGLNELRDTVRSASSRHEPFRLATSDMDIWESDHSVILGFSANDQIQALHDDLVSVVSPLGKPAYQDDPYRVHMSIVNEVSAEGVETARSIIENVDIGDFLDVSTIDLMARDGVAWGGEWVRLERFELGSGSR